MESTPDASFKILALTFTNKAAAEMRERVERLVSNASARCLLTTFHSFAGDLVRQHGHHLGWRPDFQILSEEADRLDLLQDALEGAEATSDNIAPGRMLTLITSLIENDVSPDEAEDFLARAGFEEAAAAAASYKAYCHCMISKNLIDFPSLIRQALVLLRDVAGVQKQVHRVYKHICIDEFQDTNLTQYKLLCRLVDSETKNLFVVADDDQIIYQWNGASPERINCLREDFGMYVVQLPENYRCPPEVVEVANLLIQNNFDRAAGKLPLTSFKEQGESQAINVYRFDDFTQECDWVARKIASLPPATRAGAVVLARARKMLESACEALGQHGVDSYLAVKKGQFETHPLVFVHSVLRLANARGATEHLRKVSRAFYSLEGLNLDVRDIVARSSEVEGDLLRAWAKSALARGEMDSQTRSFIEGPVQSLADKLDFWGFLSAAFQWVESLPLVASDATGAFDNYAVEKETWQALTSEIAHQYGRAEVTLNLLLQELDLRSKAPPPPAGAVPCFTVHASKGLEFNHVFLIGMVEDQLPSWSAAKKGDASREMQEERRNCFVAVTRAQETLTMTFSERVWGWNKRPSRFLGEMGLI